MLDQQLLSLEEVDPVNRPLFSLCPPIMSFHVHKLCEASLSVCVSLPPPTPFSLSPSPSLSPSLPPSLPASLLPCLSLSPTLFLSHTLSPLFPLVLSPLRANLITEVSLTQAAPHPLQASLTNLTEHSNNI